MTAPHLHALDIELAAVFGTVSVWCGPVGSATPAYARAETATHYAASTMKAGVLAALYRRAEAGELDLDARVPVVNEFASAKPGAPAFQNAQNYDQDDDVWALLGQTASLRWLARRMIIRSSNFATNLVLAHVGVPAVNEVLRIAGATHMRVERGIEDAAARDAGIDNVVTARDLALLIGKIAEGAAGSGAGQPLARPGTCAAMLDVLCAQEHLEDLAAGLPPGTRIAHKNGWVEGVRHGAGVVFPDDAPPYAIAVCTTTPLADGEDGEDGDGACTLIARIAAASWSDRHDLA